MKCWKCTQTAVVHLTDLVLQADGRKRTVETHLCLAHASEAQLLMAQAAPLARDLRQVVRQQVADGRTDGQIEGFLVSRYGQFVLLTPKASLGNAVLWVGPLLVVAAGAAVLLARGRGAPAPTNLTAEEEAEIEQLST